MCGLIGCVCSQSENLQKEKRSFVVNVKVLLKPERVLSFGKLQKKVSTCCGSPSKANAPCIINNEAVDYCQEKQKLVYLG